MKSTSSGALSGCLVWLLAFSLASTCLCPLGMAVSSIVSYNAVFSEGTIGPMICPQGTTPKLQTYATTIHEDGFERPATGYQINCLDAAGQVVSTPTEAYLLAQFGLGGGAGLLLSALLAIFLAAPAAALVARLQRKRVVK